MNVKDHEFDVRQVAVLDAHGNFNNLPFTSNYDPTYFKRANVLLTTIEIAEYELFKHE